MSFNSGAYLASHSTVSQRARAVRAARESLLVWIGPLSSTKHHGLGGLLRLWTVELIQLFKMIDEVAAALVFACMHDKFAGRVIERAQYRDLLRLPRRGNAQIRSRFRLGASEVGMRQSFALVAVEQNDVASTSLLFKKMQA